MRVIVRSQDHIPPHVHAINEADGWEARFSFSFLCNTVELFSLEQTTKGKPSQSDLEDILLNIQKDIVFYRSEWIRKNPDAGLNYKNKTFHKDRKGKVIIKKGIIKMKSKKNYNNVKILTILKEQYQSDCVILTLSNGETVSLKSDDGHKEDFS